MSSTSSPRQPAQRGTGQYSLPGAPAYADTTFNGMRGQASRSMTPSDSTRSISQAPAQQSFILPFKRSQRPSWSCTECARRKIKCDKKIPCQSCVKRGCVELCRLEGLLIPAETAAVAPKREVMPTAAPTHSSDSQAFASRNGSIGFRDGSSGALWGEAPVVDANSTRSHWGRSPEDSYRSIGQADSCSPSMSTLPMRQSFEGPLERLKQQLERIEHRVQALETRDESMVDLKARILDIEDAISLLGERHLKWEQRTGNERRAAADPPDPSEPVDMDGRRSLTFRDRQRFPDNASERFLPGSGRHSWDQEDCRPQSRRMQAEDGMMKTSNGPAEEPSTWHETRNAELAAEDAATAFEFIALGKDRRQDILAADADADSDSYTARVNTRPLSHGLATAETGNHSSTASQRTNRGMWRNANLPNAAEDKRTSSFRGFSSEVLRRIKQATNANPEHILPANILTRPNPRPTPESIFSTGLSTTSIRSVVRIAKEIGAWQHCCVHFPTFGREVEAFLTITYDTGASVDDAQLNGRDRTGDDLESWAVIDPAWMALFFVISSIAIQQMSGEESRQCGIESGGRQNHLASILLNAAMDALSLADYLVKPSVYCCQTIAILCVAGHNICGSDLLTSLLAIGIKTGQTLNLHALGKTSRFLEDCASKRSKMLAKAYPTQDGLYGSGSRKMPGETARQFAIWKKEIIDLEVGKRVWWAFTQQDYFAIPYRGVFSIFEGHYDTPLPHNCSDEDLEEGQLINRDVSELTVASKQRFTCHIAKIVCDFFEKLNRSKDTPSYSLVKSHEERLRSVTERFTICLKPREDAEVSTGTGLPSFADVLQHYLFISVHHKVIVMHRAFLSRNISSEERELSNAASIETARAVLHELERGLGINANEEGNQIDLQSRAHGGALWTIPYHAVAAATILALDMFRTGGKTMSVDETEQRKSRRREEVKRALYALSSFTKKSAIARRGCQLLSDLLEEGKRCDASLTKADKRKAGDGVGSLMKRIRIPTHGDDDGNAQPSSRTHSASSIHLNESQNAASTWRGWKASDKGASGHHHSRNNSVWSTGEKSGYNGHIPDDHNASQFHGASFGYRSSNFNPLAGNATTRTPHDSCLRQLDGNDGFASLFKLADGYGPVNGGATQGARDMHAVSHHGHPTQSRTFSSSASPDFSPGQPIPLQIDSFQSQDQANVFATPAGMPLTQKQAPESMITGMELSMPQHQLAQIRLALESIPDVWRLFDGSLGQNLVAFEESGF